MPTPIFLCIKGDNEIWEIDTALTVNDGATAAGAGGTAPATDRSGVSAYFRTNGYDLYRSEPGADPTGVGALRHVNIHVDQAGCTIVVKPVVDDAEIDVQEITHTLVEGDEGYIRNPFHYPGSKGQVDVEVTALSNPVSFGKGTIKTVPYRKESL